MIKIFICDDDTNFLELINKKISEQFEALGLEYRIYSFDTPVSLIQKMKIINPELVFLDIEMPEFNGIELSKKIKSNNLETEIVFVTSHDGCVFDVFQIRPLSFVRKSHLDKELKQSINLFIADYKTKGIDILANIENISYKVNSKDVIYIESDKNYVNIKTSDMSFKKRDKITSMEKLLNDYGFLKVHASFLINTKYWAGIKNDEIILKECKDKRVPISQRRKKEVENEFMKLNRRR